MDSNKTKERIYFNQLKQKLLITVEAKLEIRKDFKEWSGSDIQRFQVDLEQNCQSTVSEKWVYLHFKKENEKMPRIDVLNLLSRYCGYRSWDDFKHQNKLEPEPSLKQKSWSSIWLIVIIGVLVLGWFWWFTRINQVHIVFVDAYTHEKIEPASLSVSYGKNKEKAKKAMVELTVSAADTLYVDGAYYKPLKKFIDESSNDTLQIELWPDDYALMLNYFSRAKPDDWEKRRQQLNEAIHDEAKIFQSHPKHKGIEMLNKQEFIDRLVLPVNSLKNLEIQHIQYEENKIYRLRFVQRIEDYENR